ncbi:protein of unknown function [Salinihabitans flavidus]|uniref:DUF305 domain-containing protein n=1 Tax=Salinihabitans flavidus TaxID=569882 RepID=A0A1H8PHA5_9RHOB|nr:DUF305 domain-containing protein [Salinihabitans flavidus]SEO41295.1 protein of unknown function [Salinihabitans flavidus]
MSYIRFGLMILTSTLVMFILMYLNTYAWEHVFFSETRAYMAIMMGATMAVIMLAYMLGMYSNKALNIAIFVGAIIVFAVSLWLVRSQVTVSGPSYMRAMIPHHSIAIMTSERAQIRDPRARHLADEIIDAQRREIAEMRHLIADVSEGNVVESTYQDPPAEPGSVEDALANTLISKLDLAPMTEAEADQVLQSTARCFFNRSPETDPVLWANDGGAAAMKLNGVLVALEADGNPQQGAATFGAPGTTVTVRPLGELADRRQNAELVFELDAGLSVGYRGFYGCGAD